MSKFRGGGTLQTLPFKRAEEERTARTGGRQDVSSWRTTCRAGAARTWKRGSGRRQMSTLSPGGAPETDTCPSWRALFSMACVDLMKSPSGCASSHDDPPTRFPIMISYCTYQVHVSCRSMTGAALTVFILMNKIFKKRKNVGQ